MNQKKQLQEPTARKLAYQILLKFELENRRLDDLEKEFLHSAALESRDRRLLKNLVSGVIRNLLYLDWIAAQIYTGKYSKLLAKAKTILRLALFELLHLTSVPDHATVNEYVNLGKKKLGYNQARMINAVLRNYTRRKDQFNPESQINDVAELLSVTYSFPGWLVKRWIGLWGADRTGAMLKKFSENPEFDFYLNHRKTDAETIEKLLFQNQIPVEKPASSPDVFKVKDIQKLVATGILEDGLGFIQDESAHIPVNLLELNDDDIVLDVCAAPGGKFMQILLSGRKNILAVAADIDHGRLKKVKTNLRRMDIHNGFLVVADGRHLPFKPVFTKILLDAPCSGLGVISKHPDIKWRRSIEEMRVFSNLQKQLLDQASELLLQNGALVYSTCTIDPLENEDVVHGFIAGRPGNFDLQDIPERFKKYSENRIIRTFPDRDRMDGSFAAILKKI